MNDKNMPRWFKTIHKNGLKGYLSSGLVVVMLLMWGRLLLKEVPRVSTAEPTSSIQSDANAQDSLKTSGTKLEQVFLTEIPLSERDPFDFDPSPYNRTQLPVFQDVGLRHSNKSPDSDAVVVDLRRALARLNIQSIVSGNPPRVMIDGRVLKPGDSIEGFKIANINYANRTVDFEREGHTLRLKP